jgi:hypothetical protein
VHRFLLGEVGTTPDDLPAPGFLRHWLRRSTFLFCMGRDVSQGNTGFDGAGLTTPVGRSLDPTLYAGMGEAVRRVAERQAALME